MRTDVKRRSIWRMCVRPIDDRPKLGKGTVVPTYWKTVACFVSRGAALTALAARPANRFEQASIFFRGVRIASTPLPEKPVPSPETP